jgi:pimeloyl-ACP methyl ester carboxylesterase
MKRAALLRSLAGLAAPLAMPTAAFATIQQAALGPDGVPKTLPAEACSMPQIAPAGGYFTIPAAMVDSSPPAGTTFDSPPGMNRGLNEGRLRMDLRLIAFGIAPATETDPQPFPAVGALGTPNPAFALHQSALFFAKGNVAMGNACADLSVTGRRAFTAFRQAAPSAQSVRSGFPIVAELQTQVPGLTEPVLNSACAAAIRRAYTVANVLRGVNVGVSRTALGWIAVSGEDDAPHRPVNVPGTTFPQFDLAVVTKGRTVNTRFTIASTNAPNPRFPGPRQTPGAQRIPVGNPLAMPIDGKPVISPQAEVLLYIHGMDSRLEEPSDLITALHKIAQSKNKDITVIAVDLPSSGYADKIYPEDLGPVTSLGTVSVTPGALDVGGALTVAGQALLGDFVSAAAELAAFNTVKPTQAFTPIRQTPILDFIEEFIIQFVTKLDAVAPFKAQLRAVIGGSLGGNLTFRLARRTDLPWLKSVVTWSPGSIWKSFADGDEAHQLALFTQWLNAGAFNPQIKGLPGTSDKKVELPGSRSAFFSEAFDKPILPVVVPAQPSTWYDNSWPCKSSSITADRIDRQETYHWYFRLWHERLAYEQILFSQQQSADAPKTDGLPLFQLDVKPMLLACGVDDAVPFADICPATQTVAKLMSKTPGDVLFLNNTGHSIHNEHPAGFAAKLASFLNL